MFFTLKGRKAFKIHLTKSPYGCENEIEKLRDSVKRSLKIVEQRNNLDSAVVSFKVVK